MPKKDVQVALVDEGILGVNDIAEFCKNHWRQVVANLNYPASLMDPENYGQFI